MQGYRVDEAQLFRCLIKNVGVSSDEIQNRVFGYRSLRFESPVRENGHNLPVGVTQQENLRVSCLVDQDCIDWIISLVHLLDDRSDVN